MRIGIVLIAAAGFLAAGASVQGATPTPEPDSGRAQICSRLDSAIGLSLKLLAMSQAEKNFDHTPPRSAVSELEVNGHLSLATQLLELRRDRRCPGRGATLDPSVYLRAALACQADIRETGRGPGVRTREGSKTPIRCDMDAWQPTASTSAPLQGSGGGAPPAQGLPSGNAREEARRQGGPDRPPRTAVEGARPTVGSRDDEPLRVGGNVSRPELLERAEPIYTEPARQARVQGAVIVEAIIDQQGRVTHVKVLKGLPLGLDQAAVEAVQKWRFKPAELNGRPVKVYYSLTVSFQVP